MPKKFWEFPEPLPAKRPEVRKLLNEFFAEWFYKTNPRETVEKFVNKLIDIIVQEANTARKEKE